MEVLEQDTGTLSWEAFTTFAMYTMAQTRRREGSLALLLIALDPPPGISAAHGAQLEGEVRLLARILQRTIRAGDFVARHGGRSFAVIAQDAQRAGVLRLVERIQAALPSFITAWEEALPFSVSIGIALQPLSGNSLVELLPSAEQALADAMAAGGGRAQVSNVSTYADTDTGRVLRKTLQGLQQQQAERLQAQRLETRAQAIAAFERRDSEGILVKAQPGACPVCLDVTRDLYRPENLPSLPLEACLGPSGCRCVYGTPTIDPRRRPPRLERVTLAGLGVPGSLRDAALWGADARRGCKAEDLAEYLDRYPLLPIEVPLKLHEDEIAYLVRPARRALEHSGRLTSRVAHGSLFPLTRTFAGWLHLISRPPSVPGEVIGERQEGMLYLTSWRLIFTDRGAEDALLLADITGLEYFRDGVACIIGGQQRNRVFFLVKDPLQAGLCIARALRDIVAISH